MHMHRSMCTFVMYTMHCRTFCIRFECDKCLNVSFDLFARCVNNGIKERIVQLTTEWATVFAESKERIFNQVHKKWDSVEQFETLSDMFSVHIPHCKGHDTLWLCKRCCLFSLRTHKKNESNWKWEMWNEIWKGLHQHLFMSNVCSRSFHKSISCLSVGVCLYVFAALFILLHFDRFRILSWRNLFLISWLKGPKKREYIFMRR